MNFAEMPPSKQWAVLKYRGEKFAEVWFKPEGEPCALLFRIPQASFHLPGMEQHLTPENLLKGVGIAAGEVEIWREGAVSHAGMRGANPEFKHPVASPPSHVGHLEIYVRLLPAPPSGPPTTGGEPETAAPQPSAAVHTPTEEGEPGNGAPKWLELEARWKAIVSLEATIDTMRMNLESLLAEMEGSLKRTLSVEEKVHALRADVAHWTKAKSRVHHALPKVRELIHRSVWALGTPERKQLDEVYKNHIQPQVPFAHMNKVLAQLENLQKDRQILSAHANTVYLEGKSIAAEVHSALRTLQSNAVANKKKHAGGGKGKFFKQVRRLSGAE